MLAVLILLLCVSAAAQETTAKRWGRITSAPYVFSDRLGEYNIGDTVVVIAESRVYCKLQYKGITGYSLKFDFDTIDVAEKFNEDDFNPYVVAAREAEARQRARQAKWEMESAARTQFHRARNEAQGNTAQLRHRIWEGMTAQQLRTSLGNPFELRKFPNGAVLVEEWFYGCVDVIYVTNGVVSKIVWRRL